MLKHLSVRQAGDQAGGVEVEWKTLGDVVKTITAPSKVKKATYRAHGKTPIIDQGERDASFCRPASAEEK